MRKHYTFLLYHLLNEMLNDLYRNRFEKWPARALCRRNTLTHTWFAWNFVYSAGVMCGDWRGLVYWMKYEGVCRVRQTMIKSTSVVAKSSGTKCTRAIRFHPYIEMWCCAAMNTMTAEIVFGRRQQRRRRHYFIKMPFFIVVFYFEFFSISNFRCAHTHS